MSIRQAFFVSLLLTVASVAQASDHDFQQTVKADARGSVRISNVAGKVHVTGWARSEVEIKARLEDGIERVDVFSDKGRTTIKVMPSRYARSGEAELEVRVPEQSDLDVSAVSADVEVQNVLGPQRVTTVSGDIRAEFAKDFEGKTVSGDLRLQGKSQPGDVRVSSVS